MTFFVSLGEKNFNHKTKQNEYTNYDAALFAKDGQIDFYAKCLVKDSIVQVSGNGLIVEVDPSGQYPPKLALQDAKLEFVNDQLAAPQQQGHQQQGQQQPQQQPQGYQQAPQHPPYNGAPQQQPQNQMAQTMGYQQNPK
jgi:hypothetical protein